MSDELMDRKNVIQTLVLRTEGRVERIDYHPEDFFGGRESSLLSSMDLKGFFEDVTGISAELLRYGVGVSNPLAEELFFRAHGRHWPCLGDCVLFRPEGFSEEELVRFEKYFRHVLNEMTKADMEASSRESAYWEQMYDSKRANAVAVTPENELVTLAFDFNDPDCLKTYFETMDESAYPVVLDDGEAVELLDQALAGQFRICCVYDKMAAFMNGRINMFAVWMTQDDMIYDQLIFTGYDPEKQKPAPLSEKALAVMMKLLKALIAQRTSSK